MSNLSDKEREHREYHWTQQNWRSWGSWFSWGSPVGLGLFFIEIAVTIWIIRQAF
jgi:hypothetical protein